MAIEDIRRALDRTTKALTELLPDSEPKKDTIATATLRDGFAFDISGPAGQVHTDMPSAIGGGAAGFPPGWLLRAALASCTGTVIVLRAASLGIELNSLVVTVESDSDMRGMLGIGETISAGLRLRMQVQIGAANADSEQLREIVRWADAHSPVACTLREARDTPLEVKIVG